MLLLLGAVGAMFVPVGGSAPTTHTVVRGDTLGRIAKRESVSVDDLRGWNGVTGDLIEVDQVLALGPSGPGTPVWRLLRERLEELRPAAEDPGVDVGDVVDSRDESTKTLARSRKRPRAARSPGDERRDEEPSDLDAEAPEWPALTQPAAKRCLAEDAGTGDGSFGRSQGLDHDQISGAVAAFQTETLRCFDDRPGIAGEVLLDLVVGCDGRVLRSSVDSHSTGDNDFALCVAEVFRYAPFPAHARDEVEFSVPLRFTAGR